MVCTQFDLERNRQFSFRDTLKILKLFTSVRIRGSSFQNRVVLNTNDCWPVAGANPYFQ